MDQTTFKAKEKEIENALKGSTGIIDGVRGETKEAIFYEMIYCLCVPQSSALRASEFVQRLKQANFYTSKIDEQLLTQWARLKVRYHNRKVKFILDLVDNYENYFQHLLKIYTRYLTCSSSDRFRYLSVERDKFQVTGMSLKLKSQLFRNIGMHGLAILDRHILEHMIQRGLLAEEVFDKSNLSLTKRRYCDIEGRMREYADKSGLTIEQLDLLWWSNKTGFVLK